RFLSACGSELCFLLESQLNPRSAHWTGHSILTNGSAYSTYANEQTDPEDMSVAILFPEDKPLKGVNGVNVMEYPPNNDSGAKFAGMAREFADSKGLTYYWTTTNTRSDYFYTVNWSW
ncbi:MAG: hypothetical protein WCA21_04155, partial [Terracidiphilus sp.]